jgi:hypothetical protein
MLAIEINELARIPRGYKASYQLTTTKITKEKWGGVTSHAKSLPSGRFYP